MKITVIFSSTIVAMALLVMPGIAGAQGAETTDFSDRTPSAAQLIDALAPPAMMVKSFDLGASKDLAVVPHRVRLNIPFANNSAALAPQARRTLEELAAALASPALVGLRARIEGHANLTGGADHNRWLTLARAETVAQFLAGRGIAGSRLTPIGHGFDRPIPGTDPRDGRNRRVEIEAVQ